MVVCVFVCVCVCVWVVWFDSNGCRNGSVVLVVARSLWLGAKEKCRRGCASKIVSDCTVSRVFLPHKKSSLAVEKRH